jgi:plastocyanin
MKAFLLLAVTAAILAAAVGVVLNDGASPARASHGNFLVHAHDDYFHPTGSFVPGPGHATAKALCEQSTPDTTCTAVIHVAPGDSVTWVTANPPTLNPHTVTECASHDFTVCGPAVDPANPIGDSGVLAPSSPGPSGFPYGPISFANPGFYYYRCEVHPTTMRGIVQVIANNAPPAGVGGISGLLADDSAAPAQASGDDEGTALTVLIAAGASVALVAAGTRALAWIRARRRGE